MHTAWVGAWANAVTGVLEAEQLCIHAIGRGLDAVQGLVDTHATQQLDRHIGKETLDPVALSEAWTRRVLSSQVDFVFVNLDWTELDADDPHARVEPPGPGARGAVLWTTVQKSRLKGRRNDIEDELVTRLAACRPVGPALHHSATQGHSGHLMQREGPGRQASGRSPSRTRT